jgi:hypothetical protein
VPGAAAAATHLIILMHIAATCVFAYALFYVAGVKNIYERAVCFGRRLTSEREKRGGLAPLSDYFQLLGRLFYRPSSPAVIL